MLNVTDTAAKFLAEAMTSREDGSPHLLRIAFIDGEYSLALDEARDADQVIEHEGQGLLVMDSEVSEALSEATLDVQETAGEPRLTLSKS